MSKKMLLTVGILVSIVFLSLLLEFIGNIVKDSGEFSVKQIIYLIGWLGLAIVLLSQYFNKG